jgi:hypothetical protein
MRRSVYQNTEGNAPVDEKERDGIQMLKTIQ